MRRSGHDRGGVLVDPDGVEVSTLRPEREVRTTQKVINTNCDEVGVG
jgi:hypothetical protein